MKVVTDCRVARIEPHRRRGRHGHALSRPTCASGRPASRRRPFWRPWACRSPGAASSKSTRSCGSRARRHLCVRRLRRLHRRGRNAGAAARAERAPAGRLPARRPHPARPARQAARPGCLCLQGLRLAGVAGLPQLGRQPDGLPVQGELVRRRPVRPHDVRQPAPDAPPGGPGHSCAPACWRWRVSWSSGRRRWSSCTSATSTIQRHRRHQRRTATHGTAWRIR